MLKESSIKELYALVILGLVFLDGSILYVCYLPSASSFWHSPKRNPRVPLRSSGQAKGLGKPKRSAGYCPATHNNPYYSWLDAFGLQSFLDCTMFTTCCLMFTDRSRAMRRYGRCCIAGVWLRPIGCREIEFPQ
jgi:hypothetical protein